MLKSVDKCNDSGINPYYCYLDLVEDRPNFQILNSIASMNKTQICESNPQVLSVQS